jgi:hypothetical protein
MPIGRINSVVLILAASLVCEASINKIVGRLPGFRNVRIGPVGHAGSGFPARRNERSGRASRTKPVRVENLGIAADKKVRAPRAVLSRNGLDCFTTRLFWSRLLDTEANKANEELSRKTQTFLCSLRLPLLNSPRISRSFPCRYSPLTRARASWANSMIPSSDPASRA